MAEKDRLGSYAVRMSSEEIVGRAFASKVRGISEQDVRSFLRRVAAEVERLSAREDELLANIEELKTQLEVKPQVSKAELLEMLGEQTARVLSSAEQAAEQMVSDAQEESERILSEAKQQAHELHESSQTEFQEKMEEIQSRVKNLRESSLREADVVVQEARTRGREIYQEAVVVREQLLKDLLRRRDLLFEQIDELRIGREELLDSYKVVKGSFQKATDALHSVEEKASSELIANPIDVDELLKTPVELPRVLDANEPIVHVETSENKDSNVGATPEPVSDSIELPQETTEVEQEIKDTKKRGIKGYMKGALGVGEPASSLDEKITNQQVPDSVKVVETPSVSIVPKTEPTVEVDIEQKKQAAKIEQKRETTNDKKDVGALFKSIKDHKEVDVKDESKQSEKITLTGQAQTQSSSEKKNKGQAKAEKSKKKTPIKLDAVSQRDEAINGVTTSILRNAKRQLQDEQNQLLDTLRTLKSKKSVSGENLLPEEDTHIKMWSEIIHNELDAVFAKGASTITKDKVTYDADALKDAVKWVVIPLRETIIRSIDEGDIADASTRIGARYREWRNSELKNALFDALCASYNNGILSSVKSGTTLKWIASKAGQCPDCDDNALEPTLVGETFPTGQVAPPSHAGCRCVLAIA